MFAGDRVITVSTGRIGRITNSTESYDNGVPVVKVHWNGTRPGQGDWVPIGDLLPAAEDAEIDVTVTRVEDYDGHWKGEAFITHHEYGTQVHRSRQDAESWNAGRRSLKGK